MSRFGFILVSLICPLATFAADGVIEINHVAALAGGITAGDGGGYPATISASGNYILTSDLLQPSPTIGVIDVTAEDVTINLNGFAIRGTNECSMTTRNMSGILVSDDVTCTTQNGGFGVKSTAAGLTVHNGRITRVGGIGVYAASRARVFDIEVSHTGSYGLLVGSSSFVRDAVLTLGYGSGIFENGNGGAYNNITASKYDRMGFEALSNAAITNCTASWNAFFGYDLRLGTTATNISAARNGNHGISAARTLIMHCNTAWNGGMGLSGSGGYGYCVIEDNQGGTVSGLNLLATSVCDGGGACP